MEFRQMRKNERKMTPEQTEEVLRSQVYGVLCVQGDNGYPYGVPVNYGYQGGKIYIHSVSENSHKIDGIRRSSKVTMTVVSRHELLPEVYSSRYTSVIVFGTAKLLTGEAEKREAASKMMASLAPAAAQEAIHSCGYMKNVVMIEITPEHVTGKTNR